MNAYEDNVEQRIGARRKFDASGCGYSGSRSGSEADADWFMGGILIRLLIYDLPCLPVVYEIVVGVFRRAICGSGCIAIVVATILVFAEDGITCGINVKVAPRVLAKLAFNYTDMTGDRSPVTDKIDTFRIKIYNVYVDLCAVESGRCSRRRGTTADNERQRQEDDHRDSLFDHAASHVPPLCPVKHSQESTIAPSWLFR